MGRGAVPDSWQPFGLIVLDGCWALFCVVWLIGALYNARHAPAVARRGGVRSALSGGVAAVLLLIVLRGLVPASTWDVVSYRAPWLGMLGVALLVVSTAFTLWARRRLGTMWTSSAVLKVGHELRTDGPYRVTRHPIYTGLLGMLAGTTMIRGLGLWLFAMLIGVLFAEIKLRAEEQLLSGEFPEEYAEFRRRVPRLLPLVRLGRHCAGQGDR
jgi:protein-S-isoprenylcysteine O-methyltransferase Ste14